MFTHLRLTTARLTLRPLEFTDVPAICKYAGDPAIAATTLNIPHPYPAESADIFIASTHDSMKNGSAYTFAITLANQLIGCIGLTIQPMYNWAELGYWLGKPFWNQGYTSEAAQRIVGFALDDLSLNKVFARCFSHNTASAKVMQKVGMTYEGTLRQHARKDGVYYDLHCYGILRSEYEGRV